jgi:phosphoglycerate dehydrogenase-like enzyme
VAGGGDLSDRLELVHGPEGLESVLGGSEVVVVCAPDTPETRGIIDTQAFERMRPGTLLVNVARGKLVDEDALVDALRSGRLRGAGLDVFAKEPLSEGHPLWRFGNVLVTPHVSAVTPGYWDRETGLILRNLQRLLKGDPATEWENVVDKQAGY